MITYFYYEECVKDSNLSIIKTTYYNLYDFEIEELIKNLKKIKTKK